MKTPLLHIENGSVLREYTADGELIVTRDTYSHDFENYDALSQTYDFSHVMATNTPVQM